MIVGLFHFDECDCWAMCWNADAAEAKTMRESWKRGSVMVPGVSGKKRAKVLKRLRGEVSLKKQSRTAEEFESCEGVLFLFSDF